MDADVIPLHNEQTKKSCQHPLIKQVDEWEQTSIEKIHQTANDTRQQLLDIISKHNTQMKKSLEQLTQQLKTVRDDDLKEWMNKLHALKKNLITPQTINIQYDNQTTSFISKIFVSQTTDTSDECFDRAIGNIDITNNGTVLTHNQTNRYASVRGKCEYSVGEHRLRFLLENLSTNRWIFLGVISKNVPLLVTKVPSKTSYGFSGNNLVWRNGVSMKMVEDCKSDFEINDTIELLIDCDQQKLTLINQRTQKTDHLDVDITKCPFPWKLSVGLFYLSGERIRIL